MKQYPKKFYCIFRVSKKFAAVVWNNKNQLCRIFLPEISRKNLLDMIERMQNPPVAATPGPQILHSIDQINSYFSGDDFDFKRIKLDLSECTEAGKIVYKHLQKLKPGTTISYGALAKAVGKPTAARAIGNIVGKNPLPLIIPCHRVIKSDGALGGFSSSSGLGQKIEMLKIEGVEIEESQQPPRLAPPAILTPELIENGLKYLCRKDKELGKWIKKLPRFKLATDNISSPFQALLETIVYQQLTGKAAATIYARVLSLFNSNGMVNPLDIIRAKDSELRKAGLSGAKILAARDLAERTLAGEVPTLAQLERMQNQEILDRLSEIRGIGNWTAEMILIFKLGRADVLAPDDYGLKKGMAILRNRKLLPSSVELKKEGKLWMPYRTIASWYLWRIAETQLPGG
jgi:methylated-DNA-[protein]-cysteine S-methyltransferase